MTRLLLIGLLVSGCAANRSYNVVEFVGVESPNIVGEIVEPEVSWHEVQDPLAKSGMVKKRMTALPGFKTKDFIVQFGFPRRVVEAYFVNISQERIRITWPETLLPDPTKRHKWINEMPLPKMHAVTLLPDVEQDPVLLAQKHIQQGRVRMHWNLKNVIPGYIKEGKFGLVVKMDVGKVRQEFVFWFYMKEIYP